MFVIHLNQKSAAVLLRCLAYGQVAICQEEWEIGIGKVITQNIEELRRSTCKSMAEETIKRAAEKEKKEKK